MTTEHKTKTSGKAPPSNIQAEQSLLGVALLSHEALEVMATNALPGDFYRPAHQQIAAALHAAYEEDLPADVTTVADWLARAGKLEEVGGTSYLMELVVEAPSPSNAFRYGEIVHDYASQRRLLASGEEISQLAQLGHFDIHDAIEKAQTILEGVSSQNGNRTYSSLEVPDMATVFSGDLEMEQPALLTRTDGQCLLYPGRMHVFQADPGTGKSWIALHAALETIALGGAVIYVDYEDTVRGIAGRLVNLGADQAQVIERFQYVRPTGGMGPQEKAEMMTLYKRLNPDLIVIDGVAEALGRDGFDEDKNSDVVRWYSQYPRWLSRMGSAVVMIDHLSKDKEKRGRHARGAGHKLAGVDGASYAVTLVEGFSRQKAGSVKMTVAKDRHGAVGAIDEVVALVHIKPRHGGTTVRLEIERPSTPGEVEQAKPLDLMVSVSKALEDLTGPITTKTFLMICGPIGSATDVKAALARLIAEGFIEEKKGKGGRQGTLSLVAPYRAGAKPPIKPKQSSMVEQWIHNHQPKEDDGDPGPPEPTD